MLYTEKQVGYTSESGWACRNAQQYMRSHSTGLLLTEGNLISGDEQTMQYAYDALLNCTPETYLILLTNVTPIISIKK